MLHRAFAAAALVAVLFIPACGGDAGDTAADGEPAAPSEAAVLVTRDCGKTILLEKTEVPAGQTALQTLDRVAEIETDDGGKFVTAIEGVEQDTDEKLAWLFYVNGEIAEVGAAEVKLEPGDVEWWDLHNWEKNCPVPPQAH